ncbi:MAG: hypothetical protein AAFO94_03430 [Bacteroidota bacterium]
MKQLILLLSIFCTSYYSISAQVNRPQIVVDPNVITKPTQGQYIDASQLLKQGQYGRFSVGKGKNEVEFTVEKDYKGKKLGTRALKKKRVETSDYCAKDYFRTSGKINQWNVFDEQGYSDVADIVPGAIYDLSKFNGSFFDPVEAHDRNPLRIVITNDQSATTTQARVNNPKLQAVIREQGVKPIRSTVKKTTGSSFYFNANFERQYSERQMEISLGGSVPYIGGSVKFDGSHNSNKQEEQYTYLIELREDFYTLKVAGKNIAQKNFFDDPQYNNQSKWGYIESVTYGRRIVAVINSSYALSEMENKMSTSSSGLVTANAATASAAMDEQESFSYEIYVMGSNSQNNKVSVTTGRGGLDQLLSELNALISNNDKAPRYAVPVSFVLKDLEGDRVVSTYSPVEAEISSCNPEYQVLLEKLSVDKMKDGTGEKKLELYGNFQVKAYNDANKKFNSNEYNDLPPATQPFAISGVTVFAEKANPIKKGVKGSYSFEGSSKSGGDTWQLQHDALQGYFIIDVNATDKDKLSKNDEIDGSSLKIYFKDLSGEDNYAVTASDGKNVVIFNFIIKRTK